MTRSATASSETGDTPSGRRVTLLFLALAGTALAVAALESLILPALPMLQNDLDIKPAKAATWAVALTVSAAVSTPLAGSLADIHGPRRTMAGVLFLVTCGGLVSAAAHSYTMFLIGQILMGTGTGVIPIGFVVLRSVYGPDRLKASMGMFMAAITAGNCAGVLFAGPIANSLSRAWMYALPTLCAAAAGLLFHLTAAGLATPVPEGARPGGKPRPDGKAGPPRVDWPGAATLAVGLALLFVWLDRAPKDGWGAATSLALVASSVVVLVGWVYVENRVERAMVAPALLRGRGIRGPVSVGVAQGWVYSMVVYLVPQLLALPKATGLGLGADASEIGYYLCAALAAAVLSASLAGLAARRVGSRVVAGVGMLSLAAGALVLAYHHEPWQIVCGLVLTGIGAAAGSTAIFVVGASAVVPEQVGVATALITVARALGGAAGTQVAALIMTHNPILVPGGPPSDDGFRIAYLTAMAIAVAAVGLVFAFPRDSPGRPARARVRVPAAAPSSLPDGPPA
ncbi:MFS transporter [Embleya hyalina]|uniref:MFS transporter n=1 Tax=Embleya hyalina TaxID=516124 RepID=A0A401Z6R6_9ACTN|nr:MFS transporter [Embleya hyalina]GCE02533.1 MFS transporter [Embleya hyalina]